MFQQWVLCFKLKTKIIFFGKYFSVLDSKCTKEFVGGIFFTGSTALSGPERHHCLGFTITDTLHSVGVLQTNDRPVAQIFACQQATLIRDRHPCPRRDSNPQSQYASDRRPTPQTTQPLGSARNSNRLVNQLFPG